MKPAAVLVFAGLAAAQFSQLPTCAQSCANTYLQKGIGNCGVDVKCICSDSDFLGGIACCLAQPGGCDTADQSSAVVFASQLCAAQGVTSEYERCH
ncbi:extracellular membrane protein [Ophiostoma piceae UAMH 11346]|uniref:Extracellular membrane protein n=1 Tax=Ophiostoma piceae (strain UAMH 11346) TaxID=1262450 RepID=S3C0H1_OPHP1|nr:extracellular membrane protein [Ophiostoma piceae UAMH 11346]